MTTRLRAGLGPALWLLVAALAAPALAAQRPEQGGDSATDDYNMAAWLYATGKYGLAAEEFRAFLQKHPKHEKVPEAKLTLARALLRTSKPQEAADLLESVGKEHDTFARRAEVLFELGRARAALGKSAEAADTFAALVKQDADHYLADWARDRRGGLLITLRQYDPAIETLAPLVEQYRTSPQADRNRRRRMEELQKVGDAVAAGFEPLLERVHLNLGIAQAGAGKYAEAKETFEEVLALGAKGDHAAAARYHLAQTLYRLGEYAQAAEAYKDVAEGKDARAADAAFERGLALYHAEKYEPAAEAFASCAKRFPDADRAGRAELYVGTCLYLAGKYDEAAKRLADRVKRNGGDAEALYWLGMTELKRGQAESARARFEQVVKAAPESPLAADARLGQADALLAEGKEAEAAQAYQAFARKHGDHADLPRALYAAAAALNRSGDFKASETVVAAFLKQAGDHALVPQVLFISGENRFLQKAYEAAGERYAQLLKDHEGAADAPAARLRLAWVRYFVEDYPDAIKHLQTLLKAKDVPGDTAREARYLLGVCRFDQKKFDDAAEAFAAYLKDEDAKAHRAEAALKRGLALARAEKTDDAVKALESFVKAHEKSPLLPRGRYELAELLREAGKPKEAAEHYKAVAEKHPDDDLAPYAWYGLGLARKAQDQLKEAADAFGRVPERYAKADLVPEALYQQGLALKQTKDYPGARKALAAMLEKAAQHELADAARLALGQVYQAEEAWAEAAKVFGTLRDGTKDKGLKEQAAYELAWSLQQAGQADPAQEAYAFLAKTFPKSTLAADAHFQRGERAYRDKNYDEAVDAYERALASADARLADKLLYRLGWCHWAKETWAEAAKLFDRLIKEHPESDLVPEGRLQAGEAYVKLGKPADAADRLKPLVEAAPKDFDGLADARYRLGEAQLVLGRAGQAVATLTALVQQHPSYPLLAEAQFLLGKALYEEKQYEQARQRFQQAAGMTQTETAAKAQFYLGETYLAEGQARDALKAYLRVVALWSGYTEWAAAAQFEAGKAYLQLDRKDDAREAFQTVTTQYADTKWAQSAKEQLAQLGG